MYNVRIWIYWTSYYIYIYIYIRKCFKYNGIPFKIPMLSTMRRQKPKVYTLTCLKAICSASSHLSGRLERVVVCYWLNVLSQTLHVMLVIVWRLLLRNATSDVINNNNMSYAVCSNNMIVLYSMTFTIIPRPSLFQGKNHQIPMILLQQMILE